MKTLKNPRKLLSGTVFILALAVLPFGWWSMSNGNSKEIEVEGDLCAEGQSPNRLAREKSPYLLQHACNPVDWYSWGEEAFQKAREEEKPIFLSIGYSTCHWCHVMERESFEKEEIAAIMNEHFVAIKVDREELPNVDRVYMTFVQVSTGSGGWPMSVFLDPTLQPFFGGTYYPPESRMGMPGFKDILLRIGEAWKKDRENLMNMAAQNINALRAQIETSGEIEELSVSLLDGGFGYFRQSYDTRLGGFGGAPKFPRPVNFNFLLRYHARTGNESALQMTLHTLREMAKGGMYDHIGGGFHRYSVDARWHVPHFEKMLYDQGQLAVSYLEAYQITQEEVYGGVARDVLDYVLRDMTHPEGGFYSAEDADSVIDPSHPEEKGEGVFYVWTQKEIEEIVGEEGAKLFISHYGVSSAGNVLADPHEEFQGKNILYVAHSLEETARSAGKSTEEADQILSAARKKLFEVRGSRTRPHLDDKVLAGWNGLMISAMARGSQVLGEARYLEAARRAGSMILEKLHNPSSGRLQRRYRDGEAAFEASAEDYAFFIQGLLDLYEASFEIHWLQSAMSLQEKQLELFWDPKDGGFYSGTGQDPSILLRMKEDYDGAEPSANSVSVLNLLRLAQITDKDEWRQKAEKGIAVFSSRLKAFPQAMPQMLAALDYYLSKPKQIILAGTAGGDDTKAMLKVVHGRFLPNKILLLADGAGGQKELSRLLPVISTMTPLKGKATAYVCENYTCQLPTSDPAVVAELLWGATPQTVGSRPSRP